MMTIFRTLDVSLAGLTRRKHQTLINALEIIAPLKLRGDNLGHAERRIFNARQPRAEAKRLLAYHEREKARKTIPVKHEIDLSDVQELRVRLIRKFGALYPSDPQVILLTKIERQVAEGMMTKRKFQILAATLMKMTLPTSDRARRKEELRLQRGDIP